MATMGAKDYLNGANERLMEAFVLLRREHFAGSIYLAGRAVEGMLRALIWTGDREIATGKKSLETGLPEKEYEGTAYLQLGSIALRKGNNKEAYEHLRKAVKIGLPDKDSEAQAYLQLSVLEVNRKNNRGAKQYYARAKSCKSTNAQVVEQLKEMATYMARIPG